MRFSRLLSFICCVVVCGAFSTSATAQNAIGINIYATAQGGINRSLNALTRTEFSFSPLPAFGVEGTYSLNRLDEGRLVVALGFQPYSTRSVSSDPFSGRPVDDFQINTYFNFLTLSAGMRFNRVAGLPTAGFIIRGGLPLVQRYAATVDVFEVTGEAKPSTGTLQTFTLPANRAEQVLEALLDLTVAEWSVVEGQTLALMVQGGIAINSLVRFVPPTVIPPYYNIPGQDPLAGLRTFNVQPISLNIGLRYSFHTIGTL